MAIINCAQKIYSNKTARYGRDRHTSQATPAIVSTLGVLNHGTRVTALATISAEGNREERRISADNMSGTIVAYPTLVSTLVSCIQSQKPLC